MNKSTHNKCEIIHFLHITVSKQPLFTTSQQLDPFYGGSSMLCSGLKKVPISPWLVTLLHICGVISTPQLPILPETSRECRYQRAEGWCCCGERRCLCIERRYRCIEWRVFECFVMFHNVLWVFHDVSLCFKCFMMFHNVLRVFHDVALVVHDVLRRFTMYHNVLQVFHDVLLCLTIFYDV